jgi:hypothetical protein
MDNCQGFLPVKLSAIMTVLTLRNVMPFALATWDDETQIEPAQIEPAYLCCTNQGRQGKCSTVAVAASFKNIFMLMYKRT